MTQTSAVGPRSYMIGARLQSPITTNGVGSGFEVLRITEIAGNEYRAVVESSDLAMTIGDGVRLSVRDVASMKVLS